MEQQKHAVKDWGKPIVRDEFAKEIDKVMEKLGAFESTRETNWKLVGSSGGFKYYAPSSSSDVQVLSCYAEGTLDCSLSVAFELLNDEGLIKKLDDNVDSVKVLDRDHHNRLTHVTMKGMYWTAPREVVTLDHWFVEKGTIYKVGFSIEHPDVPEHPDPSVKVRAISEGWTILKPDPMHDNKCHLQMQVDIDVRLEHVPKTVQRLLAGSAQKVNAQNFGSNLKQVNKLAKQLQRKKKSSHLIVNHDGVMVEEQSLETQSDDTPEPELDFSDLKVIDVAIPVFIVLAYSAALFSSSLVAFD